MNIKNMIKRGGGEVPVHQRRGSEVVTLRNDVNRLFDEFLGDFGLTPVLFEEDRLMSFVPQVDVSETDTEIRVSAEMPGMDEKHIEIDLDDSALTIKGEKKDEHEEKTAKSYHLERSFGSFQRIIPLPVKVESSKAKAVFKKGVLYVTLPKVQGEIGRSRKLEIKAE
jgi:HSP20 family protein